MGGTPFGEGYGGFPQPNGGDGVGDLFAGADQTNFDAVVAGAQGGKGGGREGCGDERAAGVWQADTTWGKEGLAMWVIGFLQKAGVPDLGVISEKLWSELGTPTQPQCHIRPPGPPPEPLHKRKNRAWVAFYKAMGEQEQLENRLWACEQQLDKLRDKRAGLWKDCRDMQAKVGAAKGEVDKLFGAAVVENMLAGVEKLEVPGLGKVAVDMGEGRGWGENGAAEVYRLDGDEDAEDQWMGAEPYAAPVGEAWGGEGSGHSTPGKGGGGGAEADRAVEHYWEERGETPARSPSVDTAFGEGDVCHDWAEAADTGMEEEAEELEEEEDSDGGSRAVDERAKKRRKEELQKVRELGRCGKELQKVRQAAFDKKK